MRMTAEDWGTYVTNLTKDEPRNLDIAKKLGVSEATVGRWKANKSVPSPKEVVALARMYGDHPLSGLVSAGFLTWEDVDTLADRFQTPRTWAIHDFEDVELAKEIYRRAEFARLYPNGYDNLRDEKPPAWLLGY